MWFKTISALVLAFLFVSALGACNPANGMAIPADGGVDSGSTDTDADTDADTDTDTDADTDADAAADAN